MKKEKYGLGKSLKIILEDISNLSISNRYVVNTHDKKKFPIHIREDSEDLSASQNKELLNQSIESNIKVFPFDLKKIGSILKEEREKRALTIEEMSNILKLRKPIIEGIENGLWERLPHEVYVRGYIKEYANILELQHEILPYLSIKKNSETLIISNNEKKSNKKQLIINKTSSFFSKTSYIYTAIVILIIFVFIFLNINKENQENAKLEKAISLSNNVQGIQKQPLTEVLPNNKKLMITCHERTWLSVIMDGKEKKEFILNPGEVVILNAKERFDILVGNAGGIKFLLNGKEVDFTGASGQVKKVTL